METTAFTRLSRSRKMAYYQFAIQNLSKQFNIYSSFHPYKKSYMMSLVDVIIILRQLENQKG